MKHKLTPSDFSLWAALPMAHTSKIESRLQMILSSKTPRCPSPRMGMTAVAVAAAVLLPLAAIRPVPAKSAPLKSVSVQGTAGRQQSEPDWTLMTTKDKAEELRLKQAEAEDPASSQWPDKLGFLYLLHVADDGTPQSRFWARLSLAQYDRAVPLVEASLVRTRHVPPSAFAGEPVSENIARMAFAAGDYARARRCANALLSDAQQPDRDSGSASQLTQTANLILGRLALRDGSIVEAEKRLLGMGQIPGSPALDTFGPNMRLAKDLLAAGRRETVLAYFEECGKFWKNARLDAWQSEVRQGRTPNFQSSLYQ